MELITKTFGNCTEIASKTTKSSKFLTTSRSISSTFELEIVLICCRKLTETTTFSLFSGLNILVHKVYRQFGNIWRKMMKIENFESFPFSMSIPDIFHLKSCIYRSTKHTGQHLFLVDPFQHSNLRSLLKIFKKNFIKLWKLKNFGIFVNFGVKLRLFHSKTEIISSLKTTGQQTATLVNVFIIPIYGVCRNRYRNCIRTLKIGKFWVFVTFGFNLRPFSFRK